jgi:hypothetical protein
MIMAISCDPNLLPQGATQKHDRPLPHPLQLYPLSGLLATRPRLSTATTLAEQSPSYPYPAAASSAVRSTHVPPPCRL